MKTIEWKCIKIAPHNNFSTEQGTSAPKSSENNLNIILGGEHKSSIKASVFEILLCIFVCHVSLFQIALLYIHEISIVDKLQQFQNVIFCFLYPNTYVFPSSNYDFLFFLSDNILINRSPQLPLPRPKRGSSSLI